MTGESSFIGREFGNYLVLDELGSGGQGTVYKAKHRDYDYIVAIKVLNAKRVSEEDRKQFIEEAKLLKELRHDYILPFIDVVDRGDLLYMVTEYAPGGSLGDRLKNYSNQPLPLQEALTILCQIGKALYFAHQRKERVVHRDLKPDNILFNVKDEALLADFGLAMPLPSGKTQRFEAGGTLMYMAPEQFDYMVSIKCDQYALGCIAYEMLTGSYPYPYTKEAMTKEKRWIEFRNLHKTFNPEAPMKLNSQIPEYISQAILKAMAKERVDRYGDVLTFVNSLIPQTESPLERTEPASPYDTVIAPPDNPQQSFQWYNKGNRHLNDQQYKEAVEAYQQAIWHYPYFADPYANMGIAHSNLKQYEEAITDFEEAIRLKPDHAIALHNMGVVLYTLNRYNEAVEAYEQVTRITQKDANAWCSLGNALSKLQRYKEAARAYQKAIELHPDDTAVNYKLGMADVYYNLGIALKNYGDYPEAIKAYQAAISLNSGHARAYHNLGNAFYDRWKNKEAVVVYKQAVRIDPNYALAYYSLGNALKELGEVEEAKQAYEKARQLGYPDK